jgi:penicillin V acylase-like amidase (Ntn superfamily)
MQGKIENHKYSITNQKLTRLFIFAFLFMFFVMPPNASACTAFLAAKGDSVFAGNNEDYFNPCTRMWFIPASGKEFGRVYSGFNHFFPQGGMNEKGLFFDGFATAPLKIVKSKARPVFRGSLSDRAMAECATVEEVAALFGRYNLE